MTYDRASALDVFRLENFPEYPGLTIRALRPSFIGEQAIETTLPILADRSAGRPAQQKALMLLSECFADVLVDWDLKWLGRPVPPTLSGLLRLDTRFLLALVRAWVEQVAMAPAVDEPAEAEAVDEPDVADGVLAEIPMLPVPIPDWPAADADGDELALDIDEDVQAEVSVDGEAVSEVA